MKWDIQNDEGKNRRAGERRENMCYVHKFNFTQLKNGFVWMVPFLQEDSRDKKDCRRGQRGDKIDFQVFEDALSSQSRIWVPDCGAM